MTGKIVDGICEGLNRAFGDGYKIYTEQVKQGLQTPCFFVQLISPANTRIMGSRFFRENLFCIQYLPSSKEPKAECTKVQELLFLALEHITVDGALQRGVKMRGEFVDGVLSFMVNYNMIVEKANELPLMEALDTSDIKTKG